MDQRRWGDDNMDFGDLLREPKPGETLILCQETHHPIWSTDAVIDDWGRTVHRKFRKHKSDIERGIIPPINYPLLWRSPIQPTQDPPRRCFVLRDQYGTIIGVQCTTLYDGTREEATAAQEAAFTPSISDQEFNIVPNDLVQDLLVGTVTATGVGSYGVTYEITDGNEDGLWSIASTLGYLYYRGETAGIPANTSVSFTVTVTSLSPGNLMDSATITVNVLSLPPDFGTVVLWLDASDTDTLTLDGDSKVLGWADKSGNDYDVAQGNANLAPVWASDGLGTDLPGITFNNGADSAHHLLGSAPSGTFNFLHAPNSTCTVVLVLKTAEIAGASGARVAFSTRTGSTAGLQLQFNEAGSSYTLDSLTINNSGGTHSETASASYVAYNNTLATIVHRYDYSLSTRVDVEINNTDFSSTAGSGTSSGTATGTVVYLGTNAANAGASNNTNFRGTLAEIIIYSEYLSDETLDDFFSDYITPKYG